MISEAFDEKKKDMVRRPPHYTFGGIECIDAMKACSTPHEFRGYLKLACFKYLWRLGKKGTDDHLKAKWYLDRLIDEIEGITI